MSDNVPSQSAKLIQFYLRREVGILKAPIKLATYLISLNKRSIVY